MKETFSLARSIFSALALFFLMVFLVVNFQNCSGLSSSNYGDDTDTVSEGQGGVVDDLIPVGDGGGGTPTPPGGGGGLSLVFKSGQTYKGENLVGPNSFIDTLMKRVSYQSYGFGKAVAVDRNGLGYAALTNVNNNNEAKRMALESCNLLTGRRCAVIMVGNRFVINSKDLEKHLTYVLNGYKGREFKSSEIPMASAKMRNTALLKNYKEATGHKALAISVTGGVYAVYTYKWSYTPEEASRMALQQCEMESALSPCILYAINREVVFAPRVWNKQSKIDFKNNNIAKKIPPAQKNASLKAIKELIAQIGRDKYAVYITPNSYGYFGQDASDRSKAVAQARQRCNSGVHNSRCILYATSAGVVIKPNDLKSKKDFGDLFCKVVRYSCAEHLNLGCPSKKSYWIQNPSNKKAEKATCGR